jgi:NAD(P)-dependent dehydrogenase (short-subunit alcohol dehydrogenase family)
MGKKEGKTLVLGAYGSFGHCITTSLVRQGYTVVAAGRDPDKLQQLQQTLMKQYALNKNLMTTEVIDSRAKDLKHRLTQLQITAVINACGPFQNEDYHVALACIAAKTHYIDLADGTSFVAGIHTLNARAKNKGVAVVSGASTIPALSSAIIEAFQDQFSTLTSLKYGISPGLQTPRGLAITRSVLSYLGHLIDPKHHRYGWQGMYLQRYPSIRSRLMGYCDIPDRVLFKKHYQLSDVAFSAGVESKLLHVLMWLLSWLVRFKLIKSLDRYASPLLKLSHYFNWLGSEDGGMHFILSGLDKQGRSLQLTWFIEAFAGDGPEIPSAASVILAKKLLNGDFNDVGAMPCVGLISLNDYLSELSCFKIKVQSSFAPKV